MKTYELTYIISPETTTEEAEAKAKEIESLIQKNEGTILKQSSPSARTLSYPIKKYASGFMGVLEFQSEPEKLPEIQKIIGKDGKIVRHMVIIKEADKLRKERRRPLGLPRLSRTNPESFFEKEDKPTFTEGSGVLKEEKPTRTTKEKVELKDIEQKLDELLNE